MCIGRGEERKKKKIIKKENVSWGKNQFILLQENLSEFVMGMMLAPQLWAHIIPHMDMVKNKYSKK